uniref:Uncharacterized protein n=1 Tax=Pristionchus pacificus TaxID=54126 RepID=A0A2A6D2H5_PRIPA|eukprot:PDM84598.1 hypothetical protein PRIPAC_33621 [Pristionchus pacificus]
MRLRGVRAIFAAGKAEKSPPSDRRRSGGAGGFVVVTETTRGVHSCDVKKCSCELSGHTKRAHFITEI